MAQIINLTSARNIHVIWEKFQKLNPYSAEFRQEIESAVKLPDFHDMIKDRLNHLTEDSVDFICYLIENYYPDLAENLSDRHHVFYVKKRVTNCLNYIEQKPYDHYLYAFPEKGYSENDSRVRFLISVLEYVEIFDKDHETVRELLDTPLKQYQQMIQFISFFAHPKVPILLENLSYFNDYRYTGLTIAPIGNFKNKDATRALFRLEQYYLAGEDRKILELIYKTMQKHAFNIPIIAT